MDSNTNNNQTSNQPAEGAPKRKFKSFIIPNFEFSVSDYEEDYEEISEEDINRMMNDISIRFSN